jgi:hypothetical protein
LAADRARARSADRTWSADLHRDGMPLSVTSISATITSYRSATSATQAVADTENELTGCAVRSVHSESTSDRRLRLRLVVDPVPAPADPAWRAVLHGDGKFSRSMTLTSLISVRAVGRNVVAVSVTHIQRRRGDLGSQRRLRDSVLARVVAELGQRP